MMLLDHLKFQMKSNPPGTDDLEEYLGLDDGSATSTILVALELAGIVYRMGGKAVSHQGMNACGWVATLTGIGLALGNPILLEGILKDVFARYSWRKTVRPRERELVLGDWEEQYTETMGRELSAIVDRSGL